MNTGENEQGLRKILDLTRMISIASALLHFYYYCYGAFVQWEIRSLSTDRLLQNVYNTGLFSHFIKSKLVALIFLIISLLGAKGKKDEKLGFKTAFIYIEVGLLLYFISYAVMLLKTDVVLKAIAYMTVTLIGFILVVTGGTLLSRIIHLKLNNSVFNTLNETFPQEERFLNNEYSINLPTRYNLKGRYRRSWINIINPFRGLLVMGSPGSGKSYFIIQHIIKQHIEKGFSMFVYDFKFDDLTTIAYNHFLLHRDKYKVPPSVLCNKLSMT
jgi:hypothetical protein